MRFSAEEPYTNDHHQPDALSDKRDNIAQKNKDDLNFLQSSSLTEEEALAQAKKESEKDQREHTVAQSREEKDLRRAIEMSKANAEDKENILHDQPADYSEDESDFSTTGWTSSDEDDDEDDGNDQYMPEGTEENESEEAQQRRVAERLRVLEAAGILIVQGNKEDGKEGFSEGKLQNEVIVDASKQAENLLLHRRPTNRRSKPERPTRTIGEQRKRKERPGKPSRPPPPPPVEKKPEVEMDDAYERFVKLSKQVQDAQEQQKTTPLPALPSSKAAVEDQNVSEDVSLSSSYPNTPSMSKPSTSSSLFNTLKNMSSRKTGVQSPASTERRNTPTISAPMMVQRNPSPAIGTSNSANLSQQLGGMSDGESPAVVAAATTTSWSSLISNEFLSTLSDQERKRQEAIFELITTESTHVRDVQIVVDVFFNAMQPLLQTKAATVIFGNIEEILLASVSLLSDLEARQRSSEMFLTYIGDLLENHMKQMSVYIPYCVNQETATHILTAERNRNVRLDDLLKRLRSEHPSARGLDLSHFLLIPMQRLTRYPLLIGQILRYSNEEDVDRQELKSLQNAMTKAQSLLDITNESIRQRQSDERLVDLTEKINASSAGQQNGMNQVKVDLTQKTRWMGQRKILREEILIKQKSGRKITVILCNDLVILLAGKRTTDGNTNVDQYLYRMPMPLEELIVRDVPSGLTGRDDLSFQLLHQGREKVNIRCSSARACHSWMHSIDSARSDCLSAANKINKRSSKQM